MPTFIGIFILVVFIGLMWRDFKIPYVQKVVYLICAIATFYCAIATFYCVNGITFEPNLQNLEN